MTVSEVVDEIEQHGFNVTFTGGDPLYSLQDSDELLQLARELRSRDYTIWCYTGFLYEQVAADSRMALLLPYLEAMVDGPFIQSQRDISLRFRGSANQRLINIPATLASGTPTPWQDPWNQLTCH